MKKHLFILLFFIPIFSCKKSDNNSGNNPPTEIKITYTVDSASTKPGLFLTLTANKPITKDTCTVKLGSSPVLCVKLDSTHCAFMVPVLNPGNYILDLSGLNSQNSPSVTIVNYDVIANHEEVINNFLTKYSVLVDSLQINSFANSISIAEVNFMKQLRTQLVQNISSLTTEQKILIAYQMKHMNLDTTPLTKSIIDTSYISGRIMQDDPSSDILLPESLVANHYGHLADKAAFTFFTSIALAIATKNPYVLIPALLSGAAWAYLKGKTWQQSKKVSSIFSIATENLIIADGSGSTSSPIVVTNGQSVLQKTLAKFRTIRYTDKTGLHSNISEFINLNDELQTKDNQFSQLLDQLKGLFGNLLNQITTSYTVYASPVPITPNQKITNAKPSLITVNNVSNPNIAVAAVDDGSNNLKLTFTNSTNNITTQTNFTFKLTYTQAAINNTVTITEQAKFNPAVDTFTYTAHYWVPGTIVNNTLTLKLHFNNGAITGRGLITSYPLWGTVTGTTTGTNMILFFNYDNGVTPTCNLIPQPPPACPVCQMQIFPGGSIGLVENWTISGTTNNDHSTFNATYIRLNTYTQLVGNANCTYTPLVSNGTENGNFSY